MDINQYYSRVSVLAVLLALNYSCFCMSSDEVFNSTFPTSFSPAVATWYGSPEGYGTDGGACGLGDTVSKYPYYGMVSAGNQNLYQSGKGCGACYLVRCTQNPACSGNAIKVTITDECPGACNNEAIHFDLSGKAFGALAKSGQANSLRNAGRINIDYQRTRCLYKAFITFKIDLGSNPYYLAFVAEDVNGDGDLGLAEILPSNPGASWLKMQRSWGETWKVDLAQGTYGPYSVRLSNAAFKSTIVATNVIPANWVQGGHYPSRVNFPV